MNQEQLLEQIREAEAILDSFAAPPEPDAQAVQAAIEDGVMQKVAEVYSEPGGQLQSQPQPQPQTQTQTQTQVQPHEAHPQTAQTQGETQTSQNLATLVRELQQIVYTHEAQQYIQDQTQRIMREIQAHRLMGIHYTPAEIEHVLKRAIENKTDPYDEFIRYAYEKLKSKQMGLRDPASAFAMASEPQAQPAQSQQPNLPEWMQAWLRRHEPQAPPREPEPMDFGEYLKKHLLG